MAPIWFPPCEKSVLAIILSRSKGHDTQSSKIPSHSYWVGFPNCLNKLIKQTVPSFASHGRSVLLRGDQLVPSSVSTVFLACDAKASATYKHSSPCRALRSGVGGSISGKQSLGFTRPTAVFPKYHTQRFLKIASFSKPQLVVQMEVAVFLRRHLR